MKWKNYNLQEQRQALLEIIPDLEEGDNKNKLRDLAHWIDLQENERARKVMIYVYLDLNDGERLYFTTSPQVYMHSEDMRYQYSFQHEVRPEDWRGEVRKIGTNDVAERALIGEAYDADRAYPYYMHDPYYIHDTEITKENDNEKSN